MINLKQQGQHTTWTASASTPQQLEIPVVHKITGRLNAKTFDQVVSDLERIAVAHANGTLQGSLRYAIFTALGRLVLRK